MGRMWLIFVCIVTYDAYIYIMCDDTASKLCVYIICNDTTAIQFIYIYK